MLQKNWQLTGAIVVLAMVLLWGQRSGLPAQTRKNDKEIQQACLVTNDVKLTLRTYILQQIERAKRSTPTIGYYKEHPVELGKALANINRQERETKKAFSPVPC